MYVFSRFQNAITQTRNNIFSSLKVTESCPPKTINYPILTMRRPKTRPLIMVTLTGIVPVITRHRVPDPERLVDISVVSVVVSNVCYHYSLMQRGLLRVEQK